MARIICRRMWALCVAAMVVLAVAPVSARSVGAQGTKRVINGIEVAGRFLEEWSRQGSDERNVYVNGLPITEARTEISLEDGKPYLTQWFERARYELHPENTRPHDVLLGRLGAWDAEGRGKIDPTTGRTGSPGDEPFVGVPQPPDADGRAKLWFPETRHTLSGKFLEYWSRYGGVAQFGFPLSEQFEETSRADGKPYTVQYFERARMELHPEKPAPYEVELGLLGVEQHKQSPIPADSLPIAPLRGVRSVKEVIRVGVSQEPANLTAFSSSQVTSRMRALVEDGLTARDADENVFPVTAWYVPNLENNGARFTGTGDERYLQVKYKMRRGIKWSDGKEATSNDVVFHYKLRMHPNGPGNQAYHMIESVINPDKYTVIFSFRSLKQLIAYYNGLPDKQNYSFLAVFIAVRKPPIVQAYSEIAGIYPEHVLGKIPPEQIPTSSFARAPIGTGPFRVVKWTDGKEMIFEQNEHYSLTDKPLLKRIEVKFFTDSDGSFAGLKAGEVDLITSEAFNPPPGPTLTRQFGAVGMSVVSRPAAIWEHLDFYFGYEPFRDKAVREAIILGINRQRIVDSVYAGTAAVMHGTVPPLVFHSLEHPDFAKKYPDIAAKYKLPIYQYNPDKAAQLLDSAGWRCPASHTARNCAGGVREKGGQKLSFEYGTTIQAARQQIQSLVQADLRAIGVDALTKAYSARVFFDAPGPRSNGTTKFAQFAWVGSRDSDFSNWLCDSIYDPTTNRGSNEQRYCNPDLDEANRDYVTDLDQNVLVPASAEAQVILMRDIAVVPLVQRPNIEVVSAKLVNHRLSNGEVSSFWNARQWYFVR